MHGETLKPSVYFRIITFLVIPVRVMQYLD